MRLSREMSEACFDVFAAQRDNTRGELPEHRFMSFCYTTDMIQVALNNQSPMVAGTFFRNDYLIADKLKGLIIPSRIYHTISEEDYNVAMHTFEDGQSQLDPMDCDQMYSVTSRSRRALVEEREAQIVVGIRPNEGVNVPSRQIELLAPNDYLTVQKAIFKQAGYKGELQTTPISELAQTKHREAEVSSLLDRFSYNGNTFKADRVNGFRPIAVNVDMFPYKNLDYCTHLAQDQFVRWFEKTLFSGSQS